MKITIHSPEGSASRAHLEKLTEEVMADLQQEPDAVRRKLLVDLANLLRDSTPIRYQLELSPGELADRIRSYLSCLISREQEMSVKLLPSEKLRYPLLVSNSTDAPYLLDSLKIYLRRRGIGFRVVTHPIFHAHRENGKLQAIREARGDGTFESFMVLRLEEVEGERAESLRRGATEIINAVLEINRDQPDLVLVARHLGRRTEAGSQQEFWNWLMDGNFFPMAYRSLEIETDAAESRVCADGENAGFGARMLQNVLVPLGWNRKICDAPQKYRERLTRERRLVIDTTDMMSPVWKSEPLAYIGWREAGTENQWTEHGFLGLFTEKNTDQTVREVPALKERVEEAIESLGLLPGSHDFRKTIEFFHSFPKIELFFIDREELLLAVRSFTLLYRENAVKVVATRSLAPQGLSLMIFMPREFHSAEMMQRGEAFLCRYVQSSTVDTRIIHISPDHISLKLHLVPAEDDVQLDIAEIESRLTDIFRPWEQKLRSILEHRWGDHEGYELWLRYRKSFPSEYPSLVHPRFAIRDIHNIERLFEEEEDVLDLWGPFQAEESFYRLQVYSRRNSVLNEIMPFLENLNLCVLDEVDFLVHRDDEEVFVKSFRLGGDSQTTLPLYKLRGKLLPALSALRTGLVENDYLHRLLVLTGLSWQEIDVFRGYRNYFFQLGSPFTKRRVAFALIHNPQAALLLFRYFEARFKHDLGMDDPLEREVHALAPIRQDLITTLEDVSDINEDRILRVLFNLIDSTIRTNFFLRRDRGEYFFAFKISAIGIIDMPAPRPMYEIYVHSATMEGIHLRGGKIARGGIRWSDRPDDFRTEILGLMKTQMTKNSVIVPVGSKGGFVVKNTFATREEGARLSEAAYRQLMKGLLDLTDNRVHGKVVRPPNMIVFDDEDPYLVVAADKGTAHLPDTANEVAKEYGFWLGDAFASGGSQGYDHKKLGITARGAWECVKIHFLEMGLDIQEEPFTVIGIGDMSGDVFGNGMLLSRQIRLIAAFNHRHIFLDPNPDPETSFRERERLFRLGRSSWDDYDRSLISAGGGVFPRDAKDIPLSVEARQCLQVRHDSTDGDGLIRMILKAEADLLWNGGIGTYVKAGSEKNEDVGDRANDSVRINSLDLHVKVVGEGGNLGMTQLARVEYAQRGGRINTDAIDNAGGVNCSDHEVNLKIGFREFLELGILKSVEERNLLLKKIEEEVCQDVLKDNAEQAMGLSLDLIRCRSNPEPFIALVDRLESSGVLDRAGEFLPTAKEVQARTEPGYTRPELAVLMAYQKMQLYQAFLESEADLTTEFLPSFIDYFPHAIAKNFSKDLPGHPLAREITATVLTNKVVNRTGSSFLYQLFRQSGTSLDEAARTYLFFNEVIEGERLLGAIGSLFGAGDMRKAYELRLRLEDALAEFCRWTLMHQEKLEWKIIASKKLPDQIREFEKNISGFISENEWTSRKEEAQRLVEKGLSEECARRLSLLEYYRDFIPMVVLSESSETDMLSVAKVLSELRKLLNLEDVRHIMDRVPLRDQWDRQALESIQEAFGAAEMEMCRSVFKTADGNPDAFLGRQRTRVRTYRRLVDRLKSSSPTNLHPFEVLVRSLEDFAG